MGFFSTIKRRLAELTEAPPTIAERAAVRIEAKLRADATTKRGNVPSFGKFGDVPIRVDAIGEEVKVNAAPWVMAKAEELGQPAEWTEIVREETRAVLGGKR